MPTNLKPTYESFLTQILHHGWTLAQVRCEARPTRELLAAIDYFGVSRWEKYVLRFEAGLAKPDLRKGG